jgi:chromosome segregation ATPase
MAEKPKTYAQQVQEMKDQLVQKDEQINELLQKQSFIEEMQAEIAHLREQISFDNKTGQQTTVSNKAQLTDAIQRAESAEQGLRNLQAASKRQIDQINALEQQLDIAGAERDKNLGKEQKIQLLSEELKTSNLQIATLNQQLRDVRQEQNEGFARQEKEIMYLRQLTKAQKERISELTAAISDLPDLSNLKRLIGG